MEDEKEMTPHEKDLKLVEIIGMLLFNLSCSDVRRHILYTASLLEAMNCFERAKTSDYKPLNDKFVTDQLYGKVRQMAVSFVPEGARVHVRRDD